MDLFSESSFLLELFIRQTAAYIHVKRKFNIKGANEAHGEK